VHCCVLFFDLYWCLTGGRTIAALRGSELFDVIKHGVGKVIKHGVGKFDWEVRASLIQPEYCKSGHRRYLGMAVDMLSGCVG